MFKKERKMLNTRKRKRRPSFQTVWAMMKENERFMKKSSEEFDHWIKETDRIVKNNARKIGDLGNRFGEMIEHMVMPNLLTKFRELGFVFTEAYPHSVIKDIENNIHAEIDITLKNGDKVMIVEVKSKPTAADITEHVERMEKIKVYAGLHGDRRKFFGAVAGMVFNESEKTFAMKCGFYVIEPSGETFTITAPEGNPPREW
jgi:hypothetical protein